MHGLSGRAFQQVVNAGDHSGNISAASITNFGTTARNRVLPLLVFDQFEEIFTLGRDEARIQFSDAFLDELADLAEESVPAAVARRFAANPAEPENYTGQGEYRSCSFPSREDFLPRARGSAPPHRPGSAQAFPAVPDGRGWSPGGG